MHIILNDILNKIFYYILLLFFCTCCVARASSDIFIRKYAYGSLFWGGEKHSKLEVYPILASNEYIPEGTNSSQIGSKYIINQFDNIRAQKLFGIELSLVVKVVKENVVAKVTIRNNSEESYFFSKKKLPLANGVLCDERFLITTENIKLDYLGGWCNFGTIFYKEDWLEISPQSMYSYTVVLSDFYAFLPKTRMYNIGGFEYSINNKNLIYWLGAIKLMSEVFSLNYDCEFNNGLYYMDNLDVAGECKDNDIVRYLSAMGFYGVPPSHVIRTNEVLVEIDGQQIKSLRD